MGLNGLDTRRMYFIRKAGNDVDEQSQFMSERHLDWGLTSGGMDYRSANHQAHRAP